MRSAILPTLVGLSVIALAVIAFSDGSTARAQSTTTIQVGDLWFCDSSFQNGVCEVTVDAGDTVEWQWVGVAPHTTTHCADDFESCGEPREWDSSPPTAEGTFSHTFGAEDAGKTFLFRCEVHPTAMRGTITVAAAAEPTPEPPAPSEPVPAASPSPPVEAVTPEPGGVLPTAVPSTGGPPPAGGGSAGAWWLAMASVGLLIVSATLFVAARRR